MEPRRVTQAGCAHRFSAFWLRSSVVSVLISLISDTSSRRGLNVKLIFAHRSCSRGLLHLLHALAQYCSIAGSSAPFLFCRRSAASTSHICVAFQAARKFGSCGFAALCLGCLACLQFRVPAPTSAGVTSTRQHRLTIFLAR